MNSLRFLKEFTRIPQGIHSDSSRNSLGFLNELTNFPQWIHSVSSMNLLWFLNESTRIPQWIHWNSSAQWIHWNSSMNSLKFINNFINEFIHKLNWIYQQRHLIVKKYRIFSTFLKYSPIFLYTAFCIFWIYW